MLLPDAVADWSRPAGLDADRPGPPVTNFIDCVQPVFMPKKNETGLFARRPFEVGDTIFCTRAAVATTPGIFPLQLRGTADYKGQPEHTINALHTIAAVMKAYEHHSDPLHAHRPFSPFLPTTTVLDSLKSPPSLQVELVVNTIQQLYLKLEEGAVQAEQEDDASTEQDQNDTYYDAVLRAQRFLEGALVAEDVGDHYMVYSHLSSYLNHSCVPNAMLITAIEDRPNAQHPFADMVNVYLKALWPIAEGEEVTVGYYIMVRAGRTMRRKAMQTNFGFICHCTHCVNAHNEHTMTVLERCIVSIIGEPTGPLHTQEWHRNTRKLFDAFSDVGLNGTLWFSWSVHVATAMEAQGTPDLIRSYYFRRQALDWCRRWLGDSHCQTKDLASYNSFLVANKPQVKALLEKFTWEFLTSKTAQNVLCLLDSPPEDRRTGEDCVPALEELLANEKAKERKQKKNKASRERARKKGKKQQEAADSDPTRPPSEAASSDDATMPANASETQAVPTLDQAEQTATKPKSRSDSNKPEISAPDVSDQAVEMGAPSAMPLDAEQCEQNQVPPAPVTACDQVEETVASPDLTDTDQVRQDAAPLESEPAITQAAEHSAPSESMPDADPVAEKTTTPDMTLDVAERSAIAESMTNADPVAERAKSPDITPDPNQVEEDVANSRPGSIIDQVAQRSERLGSKFDAEQVAETVATPDLASNVEKVEHNALAAGLPRISDQVDVNAPSPDLTVDTDQVEQQIASLDLAHDSDQPEESSMLSNATSAATDATAAVENAELEERRSSVSEDVSIESSIDTPDDESTHSTGPDFLAVDHDTLPQDPPVATDQSEAPAAATSQDDAYRLAKTEKASHAMEVLRIQGYWRREEHSRVSGRLSAHLEDKRSGTVGKAALQTDRGLCWPASSVREASPFLMGCEQAERQQNYPTEGPAQ